MSEDQRTEVVPASVPPTATALEPTQPMEVFDLFSGVLVDVSDLAVAGEFIELYRQRVIDLQNTIKDVEAIALDQMSKLGQGTVRAGAVQLRRVRSNHYDYDLEKLQDLLELGLPEARYNEVVKTVVESKVDRNALKQVAASRPEYDAVIQAATTAIPKREGVEVKIQRGDAS